MWTQILPPPYGPPGDGASQSHVPMCLAPEVPRSLQDQRGAWFQRGRWTFQSRSWRPSWRRVCLELRTLNFQGPMTLDLSTVSSHLSISDILHSESFGRSKNQPGRPKRLDMAHVSWASQTYPECHSWEVLVRIKSYWDLKVCKEVTNTKRKTPLSLDPRIWTGRPRL